MLVEVGAPLLDDEKITIGRTLGLCAQCNKREAGSLDRFLGLGGTDPQALQKCACLPSSFILLEHSGKTFVESFDPNILGTSFDCLGLTEAMGEEAGNG